MSETIGQRDRVAIVIPAFQEAGRIGSVVQSVIADPSFSECLVVDDGSSDDTALEASSAGADVIILPFNVGYGGVLQTGIRYLYEEGYDFAVTLDGDGQHPAEHILSLVDKMRESHHDLVVGSRFIEGGRYPLPFTRRLGILFFRKILKLACGLKISDPTSGFLAMNRPAMRFCISHWYPTDFPDANALLMMSRAGLRITEVPVSMKVRKGGASMHDGLKPLTYAYKMCFSILVTLFRRIPNEWVETE